MLNKFNLLLLLLLWCSSIHAQSISINLPSFDFWGSSKMIGHVHIENYNVGVHYFHVIDKSRPYMNSYRQSSFGFSYSPIDLNYIQLGIITNTKPFPTNNSVKTNFMLNVGITIKNVRIYYIHISNGFGIRHPVNYGYDSIGLRITLRTR